MKSKSALVYVLFLIISLPLYAQQKAEVKKNLKITYELDFLQDSTNLDRKQETMFLFIRNGSSLFESANQFYIDSLNNRKELYGEKVNTGMYWTEFKFKINKGNDNQIKTVDAIQDNYFSYVEDKTDLNWKIKSDTASLFGFRCQKAIAEFGGRTWVAWFTSDVPVGDGPYKFAGLPGLVVKVSDSQGHYVFSLMSIQNYHEELPSPKAPKAIKTNKPDFFAAMERFRSNPFDYLQQTGVVFISGQDEIKKNVESYVNQRNNPIERLH